MERTVNVTVDATGGIIPKTPQYAGVQGEHNACRVAFDVSAWSEEPFVYRGEFVSGDGTGGTTDLLEVTEGRVSFPLPAVWTAAGGRAVARLVASVTVDGEETQTVYAVDVPLYFAAKQECSAAVTAQEYAGLTALVTSVQEAVDEVERRLADGSFIGPQGERGEKGEQGVQGVQGVQGEQGMQGERGEQGVSGVYVGSGEMPEGYNVQIDPDGDVSLRLAIGEVVTLPEGEEATATVTGTPDAPVLNLGIPRGATGSQGAQGERGEQGEPGQDLTDKPWTLIESVTLTEAVTSYTPTIPTNTYKELYIKAVLLIETTETTAKTVPIRIGRSVSYVGLANDVSVSNGSKVYYKAQMKLDAEGKELFTASANAYSYMGTLNQNAGDVNSGQTFEYIPRVAIWLALTTHFFGVGTTFEVWGR